VAQTRKPMPPPEPLAVDRLEGDRVVEAEIGTTGFGEILDSLAEAVTIRDRGNRILYANRAAIQNMHFGSMDELRERGPESIMDAYIVENEAGAPVAMGDIPSVRLLAGRSADPLVIRTTHRETGEVRWQMLKASPLREPDGTLVATVMVIEDVTAAKSAEQRVRFLSQATKTLMSSLDYAETLAHVAWLAVPEVADWCAVDLVDEQGRRQLVAVAHRDPKKAELAHQLARLRPVELDPERGIGRVISTGLPELYPRVTEEMMAQTPARGEYRELLEQVGLMSVLICPLTARGRTFGAMTLVNAESLRQFGEGDLEFVEEIAARAAVGVDNARLATERRQAALTLQESLLPDALPEIDGWRVAAMYRPGATGEETEVGGDFYDFLDTGSGWMVLLGDVTGKGLQAAAMTAVVRHGARFLARHHADPREIFSEIDRALRDRDGLSLCTAVCVRLGDREAVVASAGHPPPVIIRDDGRLREFGVSGDLLGAWSEGRWSLRSARIGTDETLILYTDGITDAPGREERYGLSRLRRFLIAHAGLPPQELVEALEAELDTFVAGGQRDDMAALALRPSGVSASALAGVDRVTPRAERVPRSGAGS
jgi:serine phosphatase RsbU (regulator of sigma subunit)